MLSEIGDIYRMTLKGVFGSTTETNNVFYYEVESIDPGASPAVTPRNYAWGLWAALRDSYVTDLCSVKQVFTAVKAEKLDTETGEFVFAEEYSIPTGEREGQIAGDALPSNDAYQLRLVRPTADFRHGYKRFPGVAEELQEDGVLTAPAFTALTAVAVRLVLPIDAVLSVFGEETELPGAQMNIRIGQFIHNGDPLDTPVFAFPSSIIPNDRVRPQNSRVFGHGV
jgi:hypothetical protein